MCVSICLVYFYFSLLQVQNKTHQAATRYERAHSEFDSAKETLRIAERGLTELKEQQAAEEVDKRSSNACKLDQAWQETLSNATDRVSILTLFISL